MKKIIILAAISALFCSCDYTVEESGFFRGHKSPPISGRIKNGIKMEPAFFTSPDGTTLTGYCLIPESPKGTMLYFTGVGENVNDDYARILSLCENTALRMIAVDYRGYGTSGGVTAFKEILDDSLIIHDAVRNTDTGPVFVYGHSLGTTAAIHIAQNRRLNGVILESAFTTAEEAMSSISEGLGWPLNSALRFVPGKTMREFSPQPVEKIKKVSEPLLVMHGCKDATFTPDIGKKMFDAASSPRKYFYAAKEDGHFVTIEKGEAAQKIAGFVFENL